MGAVAAVAAAAAAAVAVGAVAAAAAVAGALRGGHLWGQFLERVAAHIAPA